jgi:hypothetical protein
MHQLQTRQGLVSYMHLLYHKTPKNASKSAYFPNKKALSEVFFRASAF